ncbi:lipopolysaccharide biosynthesis protein [Loigolactobacillus bifermentans]|uniref:Transporter n=1 Tax=Loigolactobacillus bifermentans DSM 20003 TaxID=1423726 RepID=A0A0R1GGW9_9LACO|nr:hypothetical protein [Loigolactobacillus bifermentans]KRK33420.1 transporter [Loigolactobacillus bifermentans DSM 20003]QGG61412.1 hypothetical protein LB003_13545 [Loigolactobacillus bifermentans]
MAKDRFKHTLLNSSIATLSQGISLILKFGIQTLFIQILGARYLGTNSLFANLMLFLALFEFGVSSAIVFALYEPLAHQRRQQIIALTQLFQRVYRWLGLLSLLIGLGLLALIPTLTGNQTLVPHWQWAYLLLLANYLLFFLNEDKRQLLIADQLGYISVRNQCLFLVIQSVLQGLALWQTGSYLLFLAIQLGCTLVSNQLIQHHVRQRYDYLKNAAPEKVAPAIMQVIRKNVQGLIGSRISRVIVQSKDAILIGLLINVTTGGIYANYALIISGITLILEQLTGSVTASIGNLKATTQTQTQAQNVFQLHYFINFACTFVCALFLLDLLNPFIRLWLGPRYLLPQSVVILIVLNFAANQLRQTTIAFINAYGLYWKFGLKSVVETLISVGGSFILAQGFQLGIHGILLGTLISQLGLNLWWEPRLVFQDGLRAPLQAYWRRNWRFFGTFILAFCATLFIPEQLLTTASLNFLLHFGIMLLLAPLSFWLLHLTTAEFQQAKELTSHLIWLFWQRLRPSR